jgi:hypothetical protein
MQKLTHEELIRGVKFEPSDPKERNRPGSKRHAGCISGCSYGTDHQYHHHPYCQGMTWGNWEARYNNLWRDYDIAKNEVVVAAIYSVRHGENMMAESLKTHVLTVLEIEEDIRKHLASRPAAYGPLL